VIGHCLILFLAFYVAHCYDVRTLYIAQNDTCSPAPTYTCTNCGSSSFYLYPGSNQVMQYDGANCLGSYTYYYLYDPLPCNPKNECAITLQVTYYFYELTIRHTDPISAHIFYTPGMSLSTYQATVLGDADSVYWFRTRDSLFAMEKVVSSTQFTTNLGVFTIGQTNTADGWTFSVKRLINPSIPPLNPSNKVAVLFAPFSTISVVSDKTFYVGAEDEWELYVGMDSADDISGIIIGNPLFDFQGLELFPPFYDSRHGNLLYQFASGSNFFTKGCEFESNAFSTTLPIDAYECYFSSSFFFGSWFWSFSWSSFPFSLSLSLDENPWGRARANSADDMAFDLF